MTAAFLHIIHDIERVGDISENILDLIILKGEEDITFSETANTEVKRLGGLVEKSLEFSQDAFAKWDKVIAGKAIEVEGEINATEQIYRDNHIRRLGKSECESKSGIVFLDVLSNLERVGDHSHNIANKIIELNSLG